MKSLWGWLPLLILVNSCFNSGAKSAKQWSDQRGNVRVITCSRGCYQYILQPVGRDSAQRVYLTNFPDSLKTAALDAQNNQQPLPIFFSGKPTGDQQTVQEAGADDRPIPRYQLPGFQLTRISRFR